MPDLVLADPSTAVKNLSERFGLELACLVNELTVDTPPVEVERRVARLALEWGREAVSIAWGDLCRQATEADMAERRLGPEDVTLLSGRDGLWKMMTTLGPVLMATFAYRDRSVPVGSVRRTPARDVFPLHRKCRSSELCLQWECRLAIEQPFRSAQDSLEFFTHDAVSLEDTTIARHMVAVGRMVEQRWLYRRPEKIRELLRDRAARDRDTGAPLLYVSSDAHSLRRYVDEGWTPAWKNANGIRLWCVDRQTGSIIHLGGEYTFGDCHAVGELFECLSELGVLPPNGDYGEDVVAQLVLVTDGAPWLVDHVLSKFPGAVAVLDAYHAMEYLSDHAALLYVKGTPAATRLYNQMVTALLGPKPKRAPTSKTRKGHRKRKPGHRGAPAQATAAVPDAGVESLLTMLREHVPPHHLEGTHRDFIARIERESWRMDYPTLRARGIGIGSGAMESLHRNASQLRLKRPGAKWCRETVEATLNLRMLGLAGNWADFWEQDERQPWLVDAFDLAA